MQQWRELHWLFAAHPVVIDFTRTQQQFGSFDKDLAVVGNISGKPLVKSAMVDGTVGMANKLFGVNRSKDPDMASNCGGCMK